MAFDSPRDAPVLQFVLRPHVRDVTKRSLLWPVWGYRVVAPERRERELNILQKAVLGLCRAGIHSAERIGRRLHLHQDLAAVVILELHERGLLNSNGLPTPEGIEVLREETVESHRSVAGYVFRDVFSGELMPRFAERLDYVDVERHPNGFPKQLHGVPGSRRPIRPHVEWSDAPLAPMAPNAREILLAVQRHRVASRRARVVSTLDAEDDFEEPVRPHLIDRVSMIEPKPRLFFLSTYVYLPENPEDGADWHVCDPLGFGAALWLRRSIEARFEASPQLRDQVVSLFDEAINHKIHEHRQLLTMIRKDVADGLSKHFSPDVRALPFYRSLLDAKQAAEEIELLGDRVPEDKLRSALLAARITLEGAFLHFADKHPTVGVWRSLYADQRPTADNDYVRRIYDAAANAVGFILPIPKSLRDVSPEHLQSVAENRSSRKLRPIIMAAILRARDDKAHPLRIAAGRNPRMLEDLDFIAKAAGVAVHAGERFVSPGIVRDIMNCLVRVLELLHGTQEHLNQGQTVAIPSDGHRLLLDQLREKTAIELAQRLSPEVRRLRFYDSLLNVLQGLEEARLLEYPTSQLKLQRVLLNVRLTLELSILSIAQRFSTTGVWRNADTKDYERAAASVGFSLPLPRNFVLVSLEQLQSAADRLEAWRLGAMIMAAVLRARDDETHPVRISAQRAPTLLVDLADIINVAGDAVHAESQALNIERVQKTVEQLVRVVGLLHHIELNRNVG